jgi:hypothetical protein
MLVISTHHAEEVGRLAAPSVPGAGGVSGRRVPPGQPCLWGARTPWESIRTGGAERSGEHEDLRREGGQGGAGEDGRELGWR